MMVTTVTLNPALDYHITLPGLAPGEIQWFSHSSFSPGGKGINVSLLLSSLGVETRALGIAAGDFICYDPKTVVTESGFVKSRFLDDKASAACLLTLLWQMRETGTLPRYETYLTFTVHEEVGHGGATLP